MKTKDVLALPPLERPLTLSGSTVIARFRDRAEVLQHWKDIRPLLHSMSREHRPMSEQSWKVGKKNILPIMLVVSIIEGQEIRCFPDQDFEIERIEDLCEAVGISNVEVITEGEEAKE